MPTTPPQTEPRWLTPEEQHLWRTFMRMRQELDAQLARQIQAESDLSIADFSVLVVLTDVPDGRVRVLELARNLQWEKSRLSHHLARMVKRGLISRAECSEDGRGSFVLITDAGREAIEAAAPRHVELVRKLFFDPLSGEQLTQLTEISERILGAMQGCPALDPDS
ncbi:MarR family winged helix-turn-helix transcriptional regulator [Streptacidiphilus jiangxiensis]|uniref:DNA-binding transcriptional regulator, MarR family n=1 Tax=Streptacidiphilus jiangxiensis TaxID=235985 RepID=A0A1H7XBH1_STRJI|nr:MarR family winged helix-turn-helix transcriptional regulator [Streptacidiphilus jiangxiensis]SEM31071.1 DNA-binding transcriptional regulator, MarR family [Streptacidiphilus jiangxiensis]